jgi:hypothetical protein
MREDKMIDDFPPEYLQQRLRTEREFAKSSANPAARDAHAQMASLYEAKLASLSRHPAVEPVGLSLTAA